MLPGEAHVPYAKSVRETGAVAPIPMPLAALLRKEKPSTLYIGVYMEILEEFILMTSVKNVSLSRKLRDLSKTIILCNLVI